MQKHIIEMSTEEFESHAIRIFTGITELESKPESNRVNLLKLIKYDNIVERNQLIVTIEKLQSYGYIILSNNGYRITLEGSEFRKTLIDNNNANNMSQKSTQDTIVSETGHEGILIQIGKADVAIHHSVTHEQTTKAVLIDEDLLLGMMMEINNHRENNVSFESYRNGIAKSVHNCNSMEQFDGLMFRIAFDRKIDKIIQTGDLSPFEIK